jgi:hypothetical protein
MKTNLIAAVAVCLHFALGTSMTFAQWHFVEGFDAGFSQTWTSTPGVLPPESMAPIYPSNTIVDVGPPTYSFGTLDGASVLDMDTVSATPNERFGFLSQAVLSGSTGVLDARINTLDQGSATNSDDGLFDLWLVNSTDPSEYVRVGLYGNYSDTQRTWWFSATNTGVIQPSFAYTNNTWYDLRITSEPGQNLNVSIWNDAGTTQLVSYTFGFPLSALGSQFQIGFSQEHGLIGAPNYSLLSAVDYIKAVPEPAAIVGMGTGLGALLVWQRRRKQHELE